MESNTPAIIRNESFSAKALHLHSSKVALIGETYGGGKSLTETSKICDIKRGTVERIVKELGLMRTVGEGVRLAKLGRFRTNFSGRGDDLPPLDKWEIVRLRVENQSTSEICAVLNCKHPSVFLPLQKLGLTSGTGITPCFSFGQLFNRAAIVDLYCTCGLRTITDFAAEIGVGFATIEPHLSRRNPNREVGFDTARKIAEWRRDLFIYLMSNAGRTANFPGHSRVLRTFFPDLKKRYVFLREMLGQIGRQSSSGNVERLKISILEQAGKGKDSVRQFLPWAIELMPFLEMRLDQLRGPRYDLLSRQLIAQWLGTTEPVITSTLNPAHKVQPISPDDMRLLLGLKAQSKASKRGPAADIEFRQRIAILKSQGKNWNQISAMTGKSVDACRKALQRHKRVGQVNSPRWTG